MSYSELSSSHEHSEDKLCLGCFVSETLNTFARFNISPFAAAGILEFMKSKMLEAAEMMLDDLPPEADECHEE